MVDYDLAIIGGGTAGYAAALRAAENNLKVALIEKDKLGGVCLHKGCIPAKALMETSTLFSRAHHAGSFGIKLQDLSVDWPATQQYKRRVVDELYTGLVSLVKARPIDLIQGEAKFDSADTLNLDGDGRQITAKNIVVATGSHFQDLEFAPLSQHILSSDGILEIEELPKGLSIIGGGYIGIEFGSLFSRLETDVTVIEAAGNILTNHDQEMCSLLLEQLRSQGIKVEMSADIDQVKEESGKVEVTIGNSAATSTFTSDLLLVAVGRSANTKNLGLGKAGVEVDGKGFIKVDEHLMCTSENIFAIGDCINTPQLAHVSYGEGIAAADYIATGQADFPNYSAVPSIVYSEPQLASVGKTEQQAKEEGINAKVAYFNFGANSRAAISQEPQGKVKIVADEEDNILGIHILGPDASNLISEAMLAVGWEAKAGDLAHLIHPHPTFSEAIGEAALKLTGKPLHSL